MKKKYKVIFSVILIIIIVLLIIRYFDAVRLLSFESFKNNRDYFKAFVNKHYYISAACFIFSFVIMSFGIPVAAFATLLGGFLFGWFYGFIYSLIGVTIGAALAYLFSKHVIGSWIRKKFGQKLAIIENEINNNAISYFTSVRFIPSFPLFVANFVAGITNISLLTFMMTTFFGMLPYCLVYSIAGNNIGNINSPREVLSPEIILMFIMLTIIAFMPAAVKKLKKKR
ncbi:TVP38/TMEM64 family protein [Abyssisolibacter fermentans]|uniref:TVP38/TMEM64 family protein n=1 Tax=Abyssisolibacter fermentans TaxID=1766203 RepID=UPI00082D2AE1|nr:VTT domain-containing protein [Abyssisolibacter fermentans]